MGTPPNLWDLNCINMDIIRSEPIPLPEAYARCGFMQSLLLSSGNNIIPRHHQAHNNPPLIDYANPNPAPKLATPSAPIVISKKTSKPFTIPHHNNPSPPNNAPTPPPFTKPVNHYPILSHQERPKRISDAKRRETRRNKIHHATSHHPLSDY